MEKNKEVKEGFKSWMIAIGALLMTLIILCPYRLSGLVYVFLIEAFQADRKLAAMPIFMFVLMTSILGPVTGLIGQKLGPEKTTLLGFFLAALGFAGGFFAESIIVVIIFLGFVYGAGLTLGSSLVPNILKKHFGKNFNTVNGIVRGGSCVGAFIIPPFALYLFDTYGTAGTFLIISGLMLNGLPIAMLVMAAGRDDKIPNKSEKKLFQEVKETNEIPEIKRNKKTEDVVNAANDSASVDETKTDTISQIADLFRTKHSTKELNGKDEQSNKNEVSPGSLNAENYEKGMRDSSESNVAMSTEKETIKATKLQDDLEDNPLSTRNRTSEERDSNESHNTDCEQSEECDSENSEEDLNTSSNNVATLTASEANYRITNKHGGDLHSLQLNDIAFKTSDGNEQPNETALLSTKDNTVEKPPNDSIAQTKEAKKQTFWNSMKIFTNPVFLVLMALMSLLSYVLTLVWATLIDYSRDKGIPREYEVYLLMFHPLFDLVGRSCFVWVVDKGYVSYTMFQMLACLIAALSVLGLIMCTSFALLMTYAALFALGTGGQLAISSGLVFKYLEKEEQVMGMTSRMVLYAPLSFTAYPIIGYFRNELNSYDGVYYIVMAVCFVCCAITPLASRFSKARKRRRMKALEMDINA